MPAKVTLYPVRGASRHFILHEGQSPQAGRDPGNDFVVEDPRVSARHARFEWTGRAWSLRDLGSKNGTFLAGSPATGQSLQDEDWLSFGGLLARFEFVAEADLEALESDRDRRLQTSVELQQDLARERDPRVLLERLLNSVISLTGAERGFVLLIGPGGKLQAEVASGFAAEAPDERFEGSLGAIERVLETGEAVVVSDAINDSFLGKRASVLELGIGTLACVPLKSDERIFGLVYVDGKKRGGVFTELDLEILEALAANVSVVLSSLRIDREIRELLDGSGAARFEDRGFLDALGRRVAELARNTRAESFARGNVPSP